jgi:hypothetical protein
MFRLEDGEAALMHLDLEIPDDLAGRLSASSTDLSRRALEAIALEEYKSERISKAKLRKLLGIETRYELDGFLKAHDVWINYSIDDAQRDAAMLERRGF